MVVLIDASVMIASERGQVDFGAFLSGHREDEFVISAITASELLHGVHRATPSARLRREAFVEQLLAQIPVLPFDLTAARIHSALWAETAQQGSPVGAHDLLIAATALSRNATIATRDQRSFPRIPGISVLTV